MTFDTEFYFKNKPELIQNIFAEKRSNPDGYSALFLGESPDDDCSIRTMSYPILLTFIESTMVNEGRMFLHLRYATTKAIGLNQCHGFFDDHNSNYIMHNGVIKNPKNLPVDSLRLADFLNADDAFDTLIDEGESYANVFWVNLLDRSYSVFRLQTGRLYTDGKGNYSTAPFSEIFEAVKEYTIKYYDQFSLVDYDEFADDVYAPLKLKFR